MFEPINTVSIKSISLYPAVVIVGSNSCIFIRLHFVGLVIVFVIYK